MPPTKTNNKTVGRLLINADQMNNLTAVEITPGGNGFYAVTVRQVLTNQTPQMFRETYKGLLHFVYIHPALKDVRLQGTFLDFGIQDEDGQCVLSLFFRAQQEESALSQLVPAANLPKPSIQLGK